MKLVLAFAVGAVLLPAAFAQSRANNFGSLGGFGSVAQPGLGHPPAPGFSITNPAFPQRLGGVVSGSLPYGAGQFGATGRGAGGYRYRSVGVLPYIYPSYIGGYYNSYVPDGYYPQNQPNVTVYSAPPAAPAPQVIINQNFGTPQPSAETSAASDTVHIYGPASRPAAEAPPPSQDPRYFLIAYKDHSIYSALAYWIEDSTFHYITTQNTHNQASLNLIDLDFTKKLNQERNVPFDLKR